MIPMVMRIPFAFVWDSILFLLWIVVFGIFGNVSAHLSAPMRSSPIQIRGTTSTLHCLRMQGLTLGIDVHQGKCRGRCRHHTNEECGLGRSGKCAAVVVLSYGHGRIVVEEQKREDAVYWAGNGLIVFESCEIDSKPGA